MAGAESLLIRAGSWQVCCGIAVICSPGNRFSGPAGARRKAHPTRNYPLQAQGGPQLLKTTSDLILQAQAFQQVWGRNAWACVLAHAPHVPRSHGRLRNRDLSQLIASAAEGSGTTAGRGGQDQLRR